MTPPPLLPLFHLIPFFSETSFDVLRIGKIRFDVTECAGQPPKHRPDSTTHRRTDSHTRTTTNDAGRSPDGCPSHEPECDACSDVSRTAGPMNESSLVSLTLTFRYIPLARLFSNQRALDVLLEYWPRARTSSKREGDQREDETENSQREPARCRL